MTINVQTTSESDSKESGCIPKQSPRIILSTPRRWLIYVIGVLETFIFGGCIFGWAQLVYVLKNEGIFSDLCLENGYNSTENSSYIHKYKDADYAGCELQDQKFALIYTITCMVYASPAVLIGLMIHHCGLAASRVTAALMLVLGFTGLGYTTKENTGMLNVAMIFLALGGNQLRLSGMQFCNLFPKYRSTALTIITGSYATSAGLFMIFQFGQECGISLWSMCICLASVAAMCAVATTVMPWHHIPYEDQDKSSKSRDWRREDIPIIQSFISVSSLTHTIWMILVMAGVIYFNTSFNSWISRISHTNEEAGQYSLLYSLSAFVCPLMSPLPGLLTDYMSRRDSKESSYENQIHQKLKSPITALILVTCISVALQTCMFFDHYIAVYISLIALICLRPSAIGVGCDFLRIRFPPYHFYRIIGMYGTLISIFTVIQYPIFIWSQHDHLTATLFFIFLISLTMVHPLHLLSEEYRKKIIRESVREQDKDSLMLLT